MPIDLDVIIFRFLSTPSARRATRDLPASSAVHSISIHALREEGDKQEDFANCGDGISIHALREEGDLVVENPQFLT